MLIKVRQKKKKLNIFAWNILFPYVEFTDLKKCYIYINLRKILQNPLPAVPNPGYVKISHNNTRKAM